MKKEYNRPVMVACEFDKENILTDSTQATVAAKDLIEKSAENGGLGIARENIILMY